MRRSRPGAVPADAGSAVSFIYRQVSTFDARVDPECCAAGVPNGGRDIRSHQCPRKPVAEEEGHKWCKQHSPSEEKKRELASAARYQAQVRQWPEQRLGAIVKVAGTAVQEELVLLMLAGRRWMSSHGACPLHGLVYCSHTCRDYDGQAFGPDGYAPQGYAASAPFLQEKRP